MSFSIGPYELSAPVVLAPMAGVTNAPFRTMCRRFAPGLVYVNEMVMATPVVHANAKTDRMISFAPDERPRSLQLYGSDPEVMGKAVAKLCDAGRVDHIDINFGCPAAKVTRRGGGAAVPARPELLRAILRAAVSNASPYGVPVTAKFRMGLFDDWLTHIRTGEVCAEEGASRRSRCTPAPCSSTTPVRRAGMPSASSSRRSGRSRSSATATSGKRPTRCG